MALPTGMLEDEPAPLKVLLTDSSLLLLLLLTVEPTVFVFKEPSCTLSESVSPIGSVSCAVQKEQKANNKKHNRAIFRITSLG
jgi:hypothetical protein